MKKGILSYTVNLKAIACGVDIRYRKTNATASCISVEPQKVKLKEAGSKWCHQVLGDIGGQEVLEHTHAHMNAHTHLHTLIQTHTHILPSYRRNKLKRSVVYYGGICVNNVS